jgi:hypothetical protein
MTDPAPDAEEIPFMNIDDTDWASMNRPEQIRQLEVEGYLVLPEILPRYKWHPEEITLVVPAGSAVLVPSMLQHGSHPNKDTQPRALLQLGYRPAWAGPIQPVEEWEPGLVEAAPEIARPFLKSLNTTGFEWEQQNKPAGMQTEAPGINPSRWGDK